MINNIRKLRKEQGLSIRKLSKLVDLSPDTISKYEREERKPKIENWQKLADYFGVSVEYLQGKTFINKRPDKEEMTAMNDLIKVNFQFMNSDVNTTTYIRKIDYLELTIKNKRFINDYEKNGKLSGAVNLDQIVHISLLDD